MLVAASGCNRLTPYKRTLPEWVQRVHIPMAYNKTSEPGLEVKITRALQQALLEDGRLEITGKNQADAVLVTHIHTFREDPSHLGGEDIETRSQMVLVAEIELYDPRDMESPFARTPEITVIYSYESDYREEDSVPRVDALEHLASSCGNRFLLYLFNQTVLAE